MVRYKFGYKISENNIFMCNENFNNDLQIISQQLYNFCVFDSFVHQTDYGLYNVCEERKLRNNRGDNLYESILLNGDIHALYNRWCNVITHEMQQYLRPISDSQIN